MVNDFFEVNLANDAKFRVIAVFFSGRMGKAKVTENNLRNTQIMLS